MTKPLVEVACTVCEKLTLKRIGDKRRFVCSYDCRWFLQFEGRSCPVPRYHPSRRRLPPVPLPPRQIRCAWCGHAAEKVQPHTVYCTRRCLQKAAFRRRRARESSAHGEYTWTEVMRLHILFDRRCAYCTQHNPEPEPDHVIPLSRGGHNSVGNILPCCHACNAGKRDRLLHEWVAHRKALGLPPVVTTWQHTDPRYRHLTAQATA